MLDAAAADTSSAVFLYFIYFFFFIFFFSSSDASYANTLLSAAKTLYAFADQHHGLYHQSITDAADTYP
jgi:hypothetical protein